jgi:hypothetical protein
VAPFIIGGTIGVPLGAVLLTYLNPGYVRFGVGVLLVIYSTYGFAKPAFKPRQVGAAADGSIGFLNGLLGGLTGLPGFIITVWCQMRGWTKDEQRAVFQPVILAAMAVIAITLSAAGAITTETLQPTVLRFASRVAACAFAALWSASVRWAVALSACCRAVSAR